ncbi:MAG: 3-deoxy-manno-octulosonate cytidylyltransferase [Acidobacteria bacterium]|nr:3-deoxy-manno-octulosonate cytidylyltransferase [Acidobacteriota bacterium]
MKVNAIIPARYESSRLAGKPLLKIKDQTIIQMVYERTRSSSLLEDVVVATDDSRIFDHVISFGGKAVMTSTEHRSGTDRIAEVAEGLDADVIVNVQGDEPLITNKVIDALIRPFQRDSKLQMSTVMARIMDKRELFNPNVVKVVSDGNGNAIYFSRSPIPFRKSPGMNLKFDVKNDEMGHWFKHVGIYGYKREFLLAFARMKEGMLEKIEGLEQLRALENGVRIHVEQTDYSGIGIDTNEDYLQLKALLGDIE